MLVGAKSLEERTLYDDTPSCIDTALCSDQLNGGGATSDVHLDGDNNGDNRNISQNGGEKVSVGEGNPILHLGQLTPRSSMRYVAHCHPLQLPGSTNNGTQRNCQTRL